VIARTRRWRGRHIGAVYPMGRVVSTRDPAWKRRTSTDTRRISWRQPVSFLVQIGLVVGVEAADDVFHAFYRQNDATVALAHATQIAHLESTLGLWVEPAVQTTFLHPIHLLGLMFGAGQFMAFFNMIYSLGHVFVTLGFALWLFLRHRPCFAYLRNVFVLTGVLAIVVKESFPLAPPRLATGLQYHGQPFHFTDAVFGQGGGIQVGFNQYAAMPSIHVAWALLVGLGVAWLARWWLVRLLGVLYPLLMLTAVVVTGNHYLLDAGGALVVVSIALLLALAIEQRNDMQRCLGEA
jgi:hypothetical protein